MSSSNKQNTRTLPLPPMSDSADANTNDANGDDNDDCSLGCDYRLFDKLMP